MVLLHLLLFSLGYSAYHFFNDELYIDEIIAELIPVIFFGVLIQTYIWMGWL